MARITTVASKSLDFRKSLTKVDVKIWLWLATTALLVVSGIISPGYIHPDNLLRLLRQAVPFGFIAIGQTLAVLTGKVDLSVQAVTVFAGMIGCSIMLGNDGNLLTALGTVLLFMAAFGWLNGIGVVKLGINPFVMTLGTGIMLDGLTMVVTGGATKGSAAPILKYIGTGRLFDYVPISILLWILMTVVTVIILRRTVFGRSVYAVGANKRVAELAGIKADRLIIWIYIISAMLATLAGFIVSGYIGTGTLDLGDDYRMTSMAAVIMGGTLFRGGVGGYLGTASAVITLTTLTGLLTILAISEPIRRIIYGLILLAVLAITSPSKTE